VLEVRAGADELRRVRVELDHLVSIRYATGLSGDQRRRYEELLAREIELLRMCEACA
jgi:hypothetical protein